MDRQFKVYILVALGLITLCVAYYFVIYLPGKDRADRLIKNQFACSEQSKKAEIAFGKDDENSVTSSNHYDPVSGKCFVALTNIRCADFGCATLRQVTDGVENKVLATYTELVSDSGTTAWGTDMVNDTKINKEQYETIEDAYLGE